MNEDRLPTDNFSREMARLMNNPAAITVRPTTTEVRNLLGHIETWVVQVVRADGEVVAFVQFIGDDEKGRRLVLPNEVMSVINRQQDAVTTQARRRGARAAVETKREKGIPLGNTAALRKARRAPRKAKKTRKAARA